MFRPLALMIIALGLPGLLSAGDVKVDLTVKNPAINRLQARLTARAEKLNKWKDAGAIGEGANGLAELRPADTLTIDQKKEVRDLVVADNEDRYALFREWLLASNLTQAELTAVATEYAKQRRAAATAAHWVQNPKDQKWVQKKDLQE